MVGALEANGIQYTTPMPSAQVKSAVILAALNARGETVVTEREATRDHTERMLKGFGAEIETEVTAEGHVIRMMGEPELTGQRIDVPSDPSSAAFPVVAALLVEGSEVVVPNIGLNPTRSGLYATLLEMGADITFENERDTGGERAADLRVKFGPLKGVTVPPERAASMIDEFPILSALATTAEGKTVMLGVKELRVKESDRIDAMARGLEACGARVEETEDSFTVHGLGQGAVPGGGRAATHLDHRIAMSFLCLSLATKKPVTIDDAGPIQTSFPNFLPLMESLGASFTRQNS